MDRDALTIRSYRLCFRLERRIHKIDRFRLPFPWGVPLRSIGYAAAALLAVLLLGRLPIFGQLLGGLHPALRYAILPVAAGYLLTELALDGRPAHWALAAAARYLTRPRRVACCRAVPAPGTILWLGEIVIAPDERGGAYRPARIQGPCRLLLRYPGQGTARGRRLMLEQTSERPMVRGKLLSLADGQELRLR